MNNKLTIFLIVFLMFISACINIRDCRNDLNCFKGYAKTCLRSKVNLVSEGNNIRLTVRGLDIESCKISFKIEEIGENLKNQYPTEARIAVGKTLNCRINKKYSEYEQLNYIEEISNLPENFDKSCSGPIKDLMRGPLKEIIVNKLKTMLD